APMARPPVIRQTIRSAGPTASAEPSALITKSRAVISMTRTRPTRSPSGPATQAPRAQPSSADETTNPTTKGVRSNWPSTASTAPLITEESKPNRKPPTAAADARSRATAPGRAGPSPSGDPCGRAIPPDAVMPPGFPSDGWAALGAGGEPRCGVPPGRRPGDVASGGEQRPRRVGPALEPHLPRRASLDVLVVPQLPAGLQHPSQLGQHPDRVPHRAEHERGHRHVEGPVVQVEFLGEARPHGDGDGGAGGHALGLRAQPRLRLDRDDLGDLRRVVREVGPVPGAHLQYAA